MKDVIGWGILGPGRIGNDFAHCLRETPDGRVAAAGSRDIERSGAFCEKYGGKAYGSYEELVNDPDVDIVYVATPHHLHEEHTILALRAGKHVLCEKPIAVNAKQAANMYAEAEKRGLFLMDGLWSRFFPAWEFAREFIHSGEIGKIVTINSTTSWGALPTNPPGRLYNLDIAGGSLLDGGVYSLAAMSVLLGADEYPTEIKAITDIGTTGVDDHDLAIMRFPSGVLFTMLCGLQGALLETHVLCEKGTLTIPNHRNPTHVQVRTRLPGSYMGAVNRDYEFPYADEGFQFEASHVHDCLRKGLKTSPRVTQKESLMLMRIADEIRRQAGFVYPFEK
ncbi:MAG: Gfo/Idh/MocA family oxidoreductase [Clostridiales bacterium]|jgi:predicted dehydrogenase|nr:Gfo/Idh/MocA family oxidoreductase [Clostridiales bacterium]